MGEIGWNKSRQGRKASKCGRFVIIRNLATGKVRDFVLYDRDDGTEYIRPSQTECMAVAEQIASRDQSLGRQSEGNYPWGDRRPEGDGDITVYPSFDQGGETCS